MAWDSRSVKHKTSDLKLFIDKEDPDTQSRKKRSSRSGFGARAERFLHGNVPPKNERSFSERFLAVRERSVCTVLTARKALEIEQFQSALKSAVINRAKSAQKKSA